MSKKRKTKASGTTIEAKPTKCFGVDFKSRLEARWAVLLEYHPLVDLWKYEPATFTLENGWQYTPDFFIRVGGVAEGFLEIKPEKPTKEWLESQARFLDLLPVPIYICHGGFYREVPLVHRLDALGQISKDKLPGFVQTTLLSHPSAIKAAREFRFDLPQAPFRKGKPGELEGYIARWRTLERRKGGQ